jgi:glyoxylase-like metal-dependent hydrolase (beta-lactamase superfamily II)
VRADVVFNSVPPAAQPLHLGSLTLSVLHDSEIDVLNDGKVFGLGVDPAEVAAVLRSAGAPATDRIPLSVNVLLIRDGARRVLLDAGLGPKDHGGLIASLKLAGLSPGAVTDVLITHPHHDHTGGLLNANGKLAFPNATIRMAGAAWTWMKEQSPPEIIKVVAAHVQTFEPGARVAPHITSVALAGHTPGHVGYEIVSGHARLLDVGDLVHSSVLSLVKPQWSMAFDNEQGVAEETRLKTLSILTKDGELVFAPHFPFPGIGHIEAAGDAFAWKPSASTD